MDKFGIFNLLSSFLGQSVKSNDSTDNGSYLAPPTFNDKNENASAEKRATLPPLQNSMLNTMRSHDEFVKRVHARNKKP